jgi:MFS family permease
MSEPWKILAALTLARAGMGFQFQSVASVAPFLTADLGLDKTQLGWLIGLYLLPGTFIALPSGLLGARFGDKRVVLFGLLLMAAGGIGLALATGFVAANVARFVSGVGAIVLNVLLTKMVADWFDGKERLLAMAVLINAWPIGIGIALLTLGVLAQAQSWQFAIATTALYAVLGWLSVALIYRRPPAAAAQPVAGTGLKLLGRRDWIVLAAASLPWMLFNAAYQIVVSFLPAFFLERGLGVAAAGAATALNTLLIIGSVQAGGMLLKRQQNPDRLCYAAVAGWSLCILLLARSTEPLVWIVAGGLIGGLPAGAFVALPTQVLRPEQRAPGMGVFYTFYYLGCALFPAVAGALYDAAATAAAPLWLAAAAAIACVPTLALLRYVAPR